MGRKNATNAPSLPIDSYRRQIGKEQWKKNKKDMKEAKKHSDAKKATKGWQYESLLMLVSMCVLLAVVYILFYFYITPKEQNES